MVPVMYLTDPARSHSDLRVRFTPYGGDPDANYTGGFYITWLPQGGQMALDGVRNKIMLSASGTTATASHLVTRDARGAPFRWPEIRCGEEWIVTVDVPANQDSSTLRVEVDLVGRDI
jgi:hypothetical protein